MGIKTNNMRFEISKKHKRREKNPEIISSNQVNIEIRVGNFRVFLEDTLVFLL